MANLLRRLLQKMRILQDLENGLIFQQGPSQACPDPVPEIRFFLWSLIHAPSWETAEIADTYRRNNSSPQGTKTLNSWGLDIGFDYVTATIGTNIKMVETPTLNSWTGIFCRMLGHFLEPQLAQLPYLPQLMVLPTLKPDIELSLPPCEFLDVECDNFDPGNMHVDSKCRG